MEAFGTFDHTVHTRADTLRNAAQERDMSRVLENYRIIQQGCVNCHSAFQQEIRYERMKRQ
jgi:cytochrome c556